MTDLTLPMNVEDAGIPVSLTYLRTSPTHVPLGLKLVVSVGALTTLHDESVYCVRDSVVAVAVCIKYLLPGSRLQEFRRELSEYRTDRHAVSAYLTLT